MGPSSYVPAELMMQSPPTYAAPAPVTYSAPAPFTYSAPAMAAPASYVPPEQPNIPIFAAPGSFVPPAAPLSFVPPATMMAEPSQVPIFAAPSQPAPMTYAAAPMTYASAPQVMAAQPTYAYAPAAAAPGGPSIFDQVDANHDGIISRAEFNAAMFAPSAAPPTYAAPQQMPGQFMQAPAGQFMQAPVLRYA